MQQEALWTYLNPIDHRFSGDFFQMVPESPGVYWMLDSRRKLLYIGKSKNLRQRLSSYKYIRPQSSPKKLVELIERVRGIDWSLTKDERSALLLENELLRKYKPVYNTLNTRPETYLFLNTKILSRHSLELSLTTQRLDDRYSYGAFKNRRRTQKAFASLTRLLWLRLIGERPPMPSPHLLRPVIAPRVVIPINQDAKRPILSWETLLDRFLLGTSDLLLDDFFDCLPSCADFYKQLARQDLGDLQKFFEKGPRRNQKLKQAFQLPHHLIEQDWLDDLLVLAR